jgi:hypothetical protein
MEHGYNSKLYHKWQGVKKRAKNARYYGYDYDITMCEEWKSWEGFRTWSLEKGYEEGLSLDRINNNEGYFPHNCRWVTHTVQSRNTSRNNFVEYKGQTKTIAEWCEQLGLHYGSTFSRIRRGWSVERAFEESVSDARKNAIKNRPKDEKGRFI